MHVDALHRPKYAWICGKNVPLFFFFNHRYRESHQHITRFFSGKKMQKKCRAPEVGPMFCAIVKREKCTRMFPGTKNVKIYRENDPPQRPRLRFVVFCQGHCTRESHQQHTNKHTKTIFYQKLHQKSKGNKSQFYVFRDLAKSEASGTSHKQNHYPWILSQNTAKQDLGLHFLRIEGIEMHMDIEKISLWILCQHCQPKYRRPRRNTRTAEFARACAIKMHMDVPQEPISSI